MVVVFTLTTPSASNGPWLASCAVFVKNGHLVSTRYVLRYSALPFLTVL